jgi:hypothetical protein
MSLAREVMLPVTTAGLLYPALHQLIVQIAMPNMVARQFLQHFPLTASNAVTFPKQEGDAGAVINEIREGSEVLLDVTPYSAVTVIPKKIAHGFIITREVIEDALIPLQQDQLVRSALRAANKIDKDCVDTIIAGVQSGNTSLASGVSMGYTGTQFIISGSNGVGMGTYDIITAKTNVEQYNYIPDTLYVHPATKKFLERLPHFTTLTQYGLPIHQEGLLQVPGKFGDILGLDAFSSINAQASGSLGHRAFVLSRGRTTNILGQYSPAGFFVERRPLTTAVKPLEERDSIGIFITARYAPLVVQGKTIGVIDAIGD